MFDITLNGVIEAMVGIAEPLCPKRAIAARQSCLEVDDIWDVHMVIRCNSIGRPGVGLSSHIRQVEPLFF
jgi:hypothetical protein